MQIHSNLMLNIIFPSILFTAVLKVLLLTRLCSISDLVLSFHRFNNHKSDYYCLIMCHISKTRYRRHQTDFIETLSRNYEDSGCDVIQSATAGNRVRHNSDLSHTQTHTLKHSQTHSQLNQHNGLNKNSFLRWTCRR